MLSQLKVANFAIAEKVDVLFKNGMTVLSGETGAGKSIILDALGLTLGDRADTSMVRHGESKADLSAVFEIEQQAEALSWLKERDLEADNQCILRRVITSEGRSRSYINGHPSSLQNLKAIGELLIDIHSQHEHQSLLNKDNHRVILDNFSHTHALADQVTKKFKDWSKQAKHLSRLENNQDEIAAKTHLLQFQLEEFEALNLQQGELKQLEKEQSQLANAELFLAKAHDAMARCSEGENSAIEVVGSAANALQDLPSEHSQISEALNMLNEALIQIDEAGNNLRHFVDSFECNPERLAQVEERLSTIYQLARKHRCDAQELTQVQEALSKELNQYTHGEQNLEQLEKEVKILEQQYFDAAQKQRTLRSEHAQNLEKKVAEQLALMDMKSVHFSVSLSPLEKHKATQHGIDAIEFLISTNPGQPAKPINKVASGGELSRISLAIQVIIAQTSTIPTLVFDEVDVGIGGGTAQIVGRLLKSLGKKGQIICVTHLPQVASQGDSHYFISKRTQGGKVKSSIDELDQNGKTKEIARMLGGVKITDHTIAHAKEMLETA